MCVEGGGGQRQSQRQRDTDTQRGRQADRQIDGKTERLPDREARRE